MAQIDLGKLTDEWRERLRLQDWNIELSVVDFLGAYGETLWDKYKNASVTLCSPNTLPPQPVGVGDLEVTLIHELLHLHLARLSNVIEQDTPEDDALEEAVEIIAQAFAVLRRELAEAKSKCKQGSRTSPTKHAARKSAGKAHTKK